MFYLGFVSYTDSYKDDDYGNCKESMAFVTLAVQAGDAKDALKRIRDKLVVLHEEDEKYCDAHDFFLNDLVEMDEIGPKAKDISWASMLPFGDSFGEVRFYEEGDPAFRHYILKKRIGEPSKEEPIDGAALIPVAEDDEEDGEEVPLLSIARDRKQIKPLYKELRKRKIQGTLQDFNDLSDGDLYELYVVEGCLSGEIADLFEIKKAKVDYRRRKISATLGEEALYDMLRDFEMIEPIPYKGQQDEKEARTSSNENKELD